MQTKMIEIRDSGTCIAALAIRMIANGMTVDPPLHTHVAHYEDGILTRDCDKCGLDLMHLSHARKPECTCDRDPLGECAHCAPVGYGQPYSDDTWNALLADCLKELPDPRLYRVVFDLCLTCGSDENMRDSDGCWPCYGKRMADNEALARFGGDV